MCTGMGVSRAPSAARVSEVKVLSTVTNSTPAQHGYSGHTGQRSACSATNGVSLPFSDPTNHFVRDRFAAGVRWLTANRVTGGQEETLRSKAERKREKIIRKRSL